MSSHKGRTLSWILEAQQAGLGSGAWVLEGKMPVSMKPKGYWSQDNVGLDEADPWGHHEDLWLFSEGTGYLRKSHNRKVRWQWDMPQNKTGHSTETVARSSHESPALFLALRFLGDLTGQSDPNSFTFKKKKKIFFWKQSLTAIFNRKTSKCVALLVSTLPTPVSHLPRRERVEPRGLRHESHWTVQPHGHPSPVFTRQPFNK